MSTLEEVAREIIQTSFDGWHRTKPDGDSEKYLTNLADYLFIEIKAALKRVQDEALTSVLPCDEDCRKHALRFYQSPESSTGFLTGTRWLRANLRKPAPQRLSDEELGIAAYTSCKKRYQTNVLIADYTGGYRDGYRACEARLLGEKKEGE